jgi:hypothetical protein
VPHPASQVVVALDHLGVYPKPAVHFPATHLEAAHVRLADQRLGLSRVDAQPQATLAAGTDGQIALDEEGKHRVGSAARASRPAVCDRRPRPGAEGDPRRPPPLLLGAEPVHTQFLLSIQLRWQEGVRHKYELTAHEKLFGAGFSTVPFAAGAVDVYTGNTHHIDVDAGALNLSYALGFWDGPLPPDVPYLHPLNVCQDIVDDEVDMRFEDEYRGILSKQSDFSFTKLRWSTGIQAFSETIKSLGEICATPASSSRIVDVYRRGFREVRERYGVMLPVNEAATARAQLAAALTDLLHDPRAGRRHRMMVDRFEVYCALRDTGGINDELREVVGRRITE